MPAHEWGSLWHTLSRAADRDGPDQAARRISGPRGSLAFSQLVGTSSLGAGAGDRLARLAGRNVLLAAKDQLTAALALIELDGIARRIVLCPPDIAPEHMAPIAATAEIDIAVVDDAALGGRSFTVPIVTATGPCPSAVAVDRTPRHATEWILLTSGTTGVPKLVAHSLASLAGPVTGAPVPANSPAVQPVWSTFYDFRRYGGLQIFLRAVLGGGSMVLSDAHESTADFLARAGASGVTHISGTPSHWRRAMMSPQIRSFRPGYVRLSGEIADQAVLDALRHCFPDSSIAHAFASTEAGVAFDVGDGRAGFPEALIGRPAAGVEMRVEDGTLRIRSARTATRYLGCDAPPLRGADGFVDTGDVVEPTGGRYHFAGRRGGIIIIIINVGGAKVHPEEVEAVINRHPGVRMSLVRARRSPITGAVVVADVVVRADNHVTDDVEQLKREVLDLCSGALPAHKVPATIRIVPALEVGPAGKLVRQTG